MTRCVDRRQLLRGGLLAGGGMALSWPTASWAQPVSPGIVAPLASLSGDDLTLEVAHAMMTIDGRPSHAISINGSAPAPLIRLREGQTARLTVLNRLDEETSIHWHGLLVPAAMDGVPGISFPGIPARSRFTYEFPIVQSGTYWYHSHSGLQEQMGHYGPIVIDPAAPDPIASDREHVVMLSDHSPLHPHVIFKKLKQQSGYFNYQKQTLAGLIGGRDQRAAERLQWGAMRMDPSDISDVTGSTYTYLVNGHGPLDNWTALFAPGERVRLRFINASAMTIFNVRIPGLRLTIVQADGVDISPVEVDEFQITVAETYDVIVTPHDDRAYTVIGEAVDRSGLARATLAPRAGMRTDMPRVRARPLATMRDMGMDMGAMGHGGAHAAAPAAMPDMAGMKGMDHSGMAAMDHSAMNHAGMDHAALGHAGMDHGMSGPRETGRQSTSDAAPPMTPSTDGMAGRSMKMRDPANAPQVRMGPGVQTITPMPVDRTGEPGQGLHDVDGKVLVYRDLVARVRNPDVRAPERAMEIHLTANMERYMWSFDGVKFSAVEAPIAFVHNERVRVTLVNDTMMAHPIHLHGHYFELVTGHADHAPRKHTVNVLPGGTVTFDLTANALGDWAFHCHMLYHMHAGMMQVVSVRPRGEAA